MIWVFLFCYAKLIDEVDLSLCCSYQHVVDYIDTQFESYLQEELKIKRSLHNYHDSRIHACLYFIAPSGHSLKSLDLVTMKKLDSKVRLHLLMFVIVCVCVHRCDISL